MNARAPIEPFTSRVVPLPLANVDTDQIAPGTVAIATDPAVLRDGLFRYRRDEDRDFVLNRPEMQGRSILLTGPNFGCGSSREAAVWALVAFGFKAVISPSFGEIFRQNAVKSGLLPIVVAEHTADAVWRAVQSDSDVKFTVDLAAETVSASDGSLHFSFRIDAFARDLLLTGRDELDYLLDLREQVQRYEESTSIHHVTLSRIQLRTI